MVFPPTYLPGGLLSGVQATTSTEVVRLDQIQGSGSATAAPLVPARLYDNSTAQSNAGSGLETLKTFLVPFTPAIGDTFHVTVYGILAANANSKSVQIISSVSQSVVSSTSSNNKSIQMELDVKYSTTITSLGSSQIFIDGSAPVIAVAAGSSPVTFAALTFNLKVQGTTAADITMTRMTVDYIPSPV